MCKAFSCLFTKSGDVLWKFAVDSHEDLIREYKLSDDGRKQDFVRIEIPPKNGDYLNPDEWIFKVDQEKTPDWFNRAFAEMESRKIHAAWLKKLRKILPEQDLVHPFRDIEPPKKITKRHLALLRVWASVRDSVWTSVGDSILASVGDSVWTSVGASVWTSVGDSILASVGDSVWTSVGDSAWTSVGASILASVGDSFRASVGASVGDSVRAYYGSLFALPRSAWKYTDKIKTTGYPFQPAVDLWKLGLVPSFDGKEWRLHGGKDGKVLWQGKI
jgi:hypothetical protein